MKQYNYLISFYCNKSNLGTAHITRTSKLDSFDKLNELAEWIGDQHDVANVVVSSFQLVGISHVKKEKKHNAKKSD